MLNAPLFVGMSFKLEGDKYVKFFSLDLEGKMATFLLKVNTPTRTTSGTKRGHASPSKLRRLGCGFMPMQPLLTPLSLSRSLLLALVRAQFKEKDEAEQVLRTMQTCIDLIQG